MKVADLMTRDVKWCGIHDSLNSAARIMWERDCGCVPIVDDGGRIAGIVTDRDICMAAYTQGLPLFALPVELAMSPAVISCAPTDSLDTAHRLMRTHEIHRILVADSSGRLAGILSISDLANVADAGDTAEFGAAAHVTEVARTIAAIRKRRAPRAAAATEAKKPAARRKKTPAKQD